MTAHLVPGPERLLDLKFKKVKIGSLPIPALAANLVWGAALDSLKSFPEFQALMTGIEAMNKVEIHAGHVSVSYQWKRDQVRQLERQGKELLLPIEERKRLLYYDRLLRSFLARQAKERMSLADVLPYLFSAAAERTRAGKDPADENRAALFTLAVYVVKRDLAMLVERPKKVKGLTLSVSKGEIEKPEAGASSERKKHRFVRILLRDRRDLAQHFLVSAAITVSAGGGMADLLGLFKELDDSRGGSGFSFADLAADGAGVEIGKRAVGSHESALRIQQLLSERVSEGDIMPKTDHLPERIMELEFRKTYGDVDSETYRMVDEEISKRISECRAYL